MEASKGNHKSEPEPAACLLNQSFHRITDDAITGEMDIFDWAVLANQFSLPNLEAYCLHRIIEAFSLVSSTSKSII